MSGETVVIDTREPFEYQSSYVEGALNIPAGKFVSGEYQDMLADVPKDARIIVYCRTGARSNTCGHLLAQAGFTNVTNGISEGRVRQMLANQEG